MCLQLAFDFCLVQSFVWVVYCAFSLLVLCHNLLSSVHINFLPNANMHAQCNLMLNVVKNSKGCHNLDRIFQGTNFFILFKYSN